jgi:hypothetical protein
MGMGRGGTDAVILDDPSIVSSMADAVDPNVVFDNVTDDKDLLE